MIRRVTAKVNPRTTARPGDEVEFAMDVARLRLRRLT